jgi:hypothetical protein
MLIQTGTQERIIAEATASAGSSVREGSVNSDSILCTLFVNSVTSGTLTVTVVTLTDSGKEVDIINFPVVAAPTTNLLLKKSGVTMQRFKVTASYSGICDYEVYVRAMAGAGESSVRQLGSANLETDATTVTSVPGVLIPAALTDRNGLSILNYAGTGILFVSESLAKLPTQAWPIPEGGGWSLDIAAGVTIYAVSDSGNLDVRIAQSGG